MAKAREHKPVRGQVLDEIVEVERERQRLRLGGGPAAIEKERKKGKLTARERIEKLVDPGSFRELELWSKPLRTGFDIDERDLPADGIAIGYGKVDGRTVLIYSEDYTVAGGSQGVVHYAKLTRVMDTAVKMGIPCIGIVDSGGMRIQDTMGEPGLTAPIAGEGIGDSGSWMFSPPWASGVVPQISVMVGPNYAGSSYSPIMGDFLIMRKGTFMSLSPPSVIKEVTHEEVTQEEVGGALLHAEVSGTCDLIADTDEESLQMCRKLLSFLPSSNREKPPVVITRDDAERKDEELLDVSQGYDMHQVILRVVDDGDFFELKPLYAKNVIIGFARLNGQTIGIVANNPMVMDGAIDFNSSDKEARFIRFCDAFNIPLVFFVDTVGYLADKEQEKFGIERHAAKVLYAICEATVPKVTVHIGKCLAAGDLAMGTRDMGVDLVLAWPMAQVRKIDSEKAVNVIYGKELKEAANPEMLRQTKIEEFDRDYNNLFSAGALQLIDDIIDPRETRPVLIKAMDWFANKKELRPWKKHGNIPL